MPTPDYSHSNTAPTAIPRPSQEPDNAAPTAAGPGAPVLTDANPSGVGTPAPAFDNTEPAEVGTAAPELTGHAPAGIALPGMTPSDAAPAGVPLAPAAHDNTAPGAVAGAVPDFTTGAPAGIALPVMTPSDAAPAGVPLASAAHDNTAPVGRTLPSTTGTENTPQPVNYAPIIPDPTDPTMHTAPLHNAGNVILNQAFGYYRAPAAGVIKAIHLYAQKAPVGADIVLELVDVDGASFERSVSLPDGQHFAEAVLTPAHPVPAGTIVRLKPTQIGSDQPGAWLTANLVVQLLAS